MFQNYNPLLGERLSILDESGGLTADKSQRRMNDKQLLAAYELMVRARVADEMAVSYQRQKRIHTLPVNRGQEAAAVGSIMATEQQDWMVQAYRELGAVLHKGGTMKHYFLYFKGSEWGSALPGNPRVLPPSVPIASQITHAAGLAHAMQFQGSKDVVVAYFGDGATSEGDFHEGLNWAAVFKCPVIFFCTNNQYAISQSRLKQTAAPTLAQKAIAYGMPGIQVDGNDVLAVHAATAKAVEHARAGQGPVLIEAYSYRMGPHTTADDPTLYRTKEEEAEWAPRDPLLRVKAYLSRKKLWNEKKEEAARALYKEEAAQAMRDVEAMEADPLSDVFAYHYADTPRDLKEQQSDYEAFLSWKEAR
jgi:pyruvate dehydrogenase E1 component alpha subunit